MIYAIAVIINSSNEFDLLHSNPNGIFYMNNSIQRTNGIYNEFKGFLIGNWVNINLTYVEGS